MCLEIIYLIYMYIKDLALNNLLWLICYKTKQEKRSLSVIISFMCLFIEQNKLLSKDFFFHFIERTHETNSYIQAKKGEIIIILAFILLCFLAYKHFILSNILK